MKKKLIIFFLLIFVVLIYFKIMKPNKEEQNIKNNLKDKWKIELGKETELRKLKVSKTQWHGERHTFILFDITNLVSTINYIGDYDLFVGDIGYEIKNRIKEIENDLNIEKENRIDFSRDYYYTIRTKNKPRKSSETKKNILYIIFIKENNGGKMFFIEDENVADLDRFY